MTTVVAALMHDMVVSDPAARPSLEEIASRVKRLEIHEADPIGMVRKPKGGDNKKDFELLLQVFPRHIAEALRDGRPVEPEKHGTSKFFMYICSKVNIELSNPILSYIRRVRKYLF